MAPDPKTSEWLDKDRESFTAWWKQKYAVNEPESEIRIASGVGHWGKKKKDEAA